MIFRIQFFMHVLMLAILLLGISTDIQAASSAQVRDVRLWTAPDHSRLVFDLNQSIEYQVFRLHKPERIVIDLNKTKLKTKFTHLKLPDPVIRSIRNGNRPDALRIVLDVRETVKPRSFLLKPMKGKPHRLVIDLIRHASKSKQPKTVKSMRNRKEIVIAIDAGHGGEDPGAIGKYGLQEKIVTLGIAKKLANAINAKPGMRAILTRKGDYYVPLKHRIRRARKIRADLMISIHADAVKDRRVKGGSVYTLSERGATQDKVAAALAAKENSADAVGGFLPNDVGDPMVNMILGDMAKRDSLNSAYLFAETILKGMNHVGPIKYNAPKRARFVVLGALEIPSVLVEVDFISNPKRERLLKSKKYQMKLANALLAASTKFLKRQGRLGKKAEYDDKIFSEASIAISGF
ncbi:MAG: N-acetylmuramoyl-L-alanine amidase [Mariprofundaceae bacterium]